MKLVTLLIPCYNSTPFVHRVFDSILAQTYSNMEIIAVDDGSTDGTADYIERGYRSKLEAKGCTLKVLAQENTGQSGAINNGLKLVTGDYLVWPDSDDYFCTDKAIEIMERELSAAGEGVGMVHSYGAFVDEDTLSIASKTCRKVRGNHIIPEFENFLRGENWWWPPIMVMAKVDVIDKVIPNREIYTNKECGQNAQMMLPILYHYDCLTITEELAHILVRKNSHSRDAKRHDGVIRLSRVHENAYLKTFDMMSFKTEEDKVYYMNFVKTLFSLARLGVDFVYGERSEFRRRLSCELTLEMLDKYELEKLRLYKNLLYFPFRSYLFRRIRNYVAKLKRKEAEKRG